MCNVAACGLRNKSRNERAKRRLLRILRVTLKKKGFIASPVKISLTEKKKKKKKRKYLHKYEH